MNAEVKLTARMLRAAAFLPWLSAALTILAAASLVFRCGGIPAMVAILLGALACFYGWRIALDAWLFGDILSGALTTEELDASLNRVTPSALEGPPASSEAGGAATSLGMTPRPPRPWSERCRGARMLIVKGATLTLLQLVALALVRSCTH
ncbi:MAG TPA: hypothetical protein VM733_06720 [Thermoanaerobaculia bacterium]|nr:hypothetical protein [Thermoanaerobaculia bacterium]